MCEENGKFLDTSIRHPGSTSDYLAFVTNSLHTKVEKEGCVAPGLGLHGENGYVLNECVVTPFEKIPLVAKTHVIFTIHRFAFARNAPLV